MNDLVEIMEYLKEEDMRADDWNSICQIARIRGFVQGLIDQYSIGQEKQYIGVGNGQE